MLRPAVGSIWTLVCRRRRCSLGTVLRCRRLHRRSAPEASGSTILHPKDYRDVQVNKTAGRSFHLLTVGRTHHSRRHAHHRHTEAHTRLSGHFRRERLTPPITTNSNLFSSNNSRNNCLPVRPRHTRRLRRRTAGQSATGRPARRARLALLLVLPSLPLVSSIRLIRMQPPPHRNLRRRTHNRIFGTMAARNDLSERSGRRSAVSSTVNGVQRRAREG